MKRYTLLWLTIAALLLPAISLSAIPLNTNLLINGDAETGDMTGWMPTDEIQTVPSANAGNQGLPVGESIGAFSFTGAAGGRAESAEQTIDIQSLSTLIDGAGLQFGFRGLVQSRSSDTARVSLRFQDRDGTVITSADFTDTSISGLHDWEVFEQFGLLPVGTRTITVEMAISRTSGGSSDAFIDNLSLVLVPEPGGLALLLLGGAAVVGVGRRS